MTVIRPLLNVVSAFKRLIAIYSGVQVLHTMCGFHLYPTSELGAKHLQEHKSGEGLGIIKKNCRTVSQVADGHRGLAGIQEVLRSVAKGAAFHVWP